MLTNLPASHANFLGFLSLLTYVMTLLPSSLKAVFPNLKKSKIVINLLITNLMNSFLKYRRQLGIIAFLFALIHAILIIIKRNVDLFDIKTYQISVEGTSTLIIFAILALTSNDWSVKKLKKNWKKLHQLTYTAMFLLLWHIQEKMSGNWHIITTIELALMTIVILLFCRRRWLEYHKQANQQSQKNMSTNIKKSYLPQISKLTNMLSKILCSGEGLIVLSLLVLGLIKLHLGQTNKPINNEVIINPVKSIYTSGMRVYSLAISSDGKILVSGNFQKDIDVRDVNSGKMIYQLCGHVNSVNSVAISPNNQIIASGSWDNSIKIWDVKTGKLVKTLSGHQDDVKAVAFSPNSELLVSSSWDKTIKVWNVKTGNIILNLPQLDEIRTVKFSPDGKFLASGGESGKINVWNLSTEKLKTPLAAHEKTIWSLAFSGNNKYLASGSSDNTVKLWNIETGELLSVFTGHDKAVYSVEFSPDGETLASGSYDKTIKLWNVQNGNLINTLKGHNKPVWSLAFNPHIKHDIDHNYYTLMSGGADGIVQFWQLPTSNHFDLFRQGINYATKAAYLSQTAKSSSDWKQVSQYWQKSIHSMSNIPSSHVNYAIAQQKILEYQTNFQYAYRNIN